MGSMIYGIVSNCHIGYFRLQHIMGGGQLLCILYTQADTYRTQHRSKHGSRLQSYSRNKSISNRYSVDDLYFMGHLVAVFLDSTFKLH